MRTLDQWFADYSVSHQNKTNKAIHYLCVPAIFFSIVGLLMSIPPGALEDVFPGALQLVENWAVVVLAFLLLFYFRLSFSMGIKIFFFAALCILGNHFIGRQVPLFIFSLVLFAVAWIGQFYGHKIEGKEPSFLKDLQFLLIGPAWVIDNIFK